jgi:hypothetical protein
METGKLSLLQRFINRSKLRNLRDRWYNPEADPTSLLGDLVTQMGVSEEAIFKAIVPELAHPVYKLVNPKPPFVPWCIKLRHELSKAKLRTADALWEYIGKDANSGIVKLSRELGIPEDHLLKFLLELGKYELDKPDATEYQVTNTEWQKNPWFKQHSSGIVLLLAVLVIATVSMLGRAFFTNDGRAVITTRNLETDHSFVATDIEYGILLPGDEYFTDPNELISSILVRDIVIGKAIRFEDVRTAQIVPVINIEQDSIIARKELTLTWVLYEPGTVRKFDDAVGMKAKISLKSGQPLLKTNLVPPIPPPTPSAGP